MSVSARGCLTQDVPDASCVGDRLAQLLVDFVLRVAVTRVRESVEENADFPTSSVQQTLIDRHDTLPTMPAPVCRGASDSICADPESVERIEVYIAIVRSDTSCGSGPRRMPPDHGTGARSPHTIFVCGF